MGKTDCVWVLTTARWAGQAWGRVHIMLPITVKPMYSFTGFSVFAWLISNSSFSKCVKGGGIQYTCNSTEEAKK